MKCRERWEEGRRREEGRREELCSRSASVYKGLRPTLANNNLSLSPTHSFVSGDRNRGGGEVGKHTHQKKESHTGWICLNDATRVKSTHTHTKKVKNENKRKPGFMYTHAHTHKKLISAHPHAHTHAHTKASGKMMKWKSMPEKKNKRACVWNDNGETNKR